LTITVSDLNKSNNDGFYKESTWQWTMESRLLKLITNNPSTITMNIVDAFCVHVCAHIGGFVITPEKHHKLSQESKASRTGAKQDSPEKWIQISALHADLETDSLVHPPN
jgi:hypothetical protein